MASEEVLQLLKMKCLPLLLYSLELYLTDSRDSHVVSRSPADLVANVIYDFFLLKTCLQTRSD